MNSTSRLTLILSAFLSLPGADQADEGSRRHDRLTHRINASRYYLALSVWWRAYGETNADSQATTRAGMLSRLA